MSCVLRNMLAGTSSKAHQNTTGENYASWKITTHAGLRYFDLFKSGSE